MARPLPEGAACIPLEMRPVAGLRDRFKDEEIQAVVDATLHKEAQAGHALEFSADG